MLVSPRESSGQVDIGERVAMKMVPRRRFPAPGLRRPRRAGSPWRSQARCPRSRSQQRARSPAPRVRARVESWISVKRPNSSATRGSEGSRMKPRTVASGNGSPLRGERGDEHLRGDLPDDGPRVRLGDHVFQRRPWMESRSCHGSSPASSMGGTGSRGDRVRRRSGSVPIGEAKSAARRDQRWWSLLRKHAASDLPLVRPVCCAKAAQHHPRCAAPTMR